MLDRLKSVVSSIRNYFEGRNQLSDIKYDFFAGRKNEMPIGRAMARELRETIAQATADRKLTPEEKELLLTLTASFRQDDPNERVKKAKINLFKEIVDGVLKDGRVENYEMELINEMRHDLNVEGERIDIMLAEVKKLYDEEKKQSDQ